MRDRQAKEVTLDDSHLKDDIQDFNSLENKIEDMKNEDKQELKKQSSDSPAPWDYEPDPQNDPPESKYRAGQQVLLDNYKINGTYQNESAEGKILEAVFEEGAWSYRIELSPGDEVWALDDDINSVKTASRRRAMRTRRHAGGMLGSWLDEFSPEEIAAMPVQVVFMGPEGLTNKEYATIDEARQDHPDMTMNPMQAMHGGLYTDEFGPSGSPCLRFEDSEAYKTLSSSRRQAALTDINGVPVAVGDKVRNIVRMNTYVDPEKKWSVPVENWMSMDDTLEVSEIDEANQRVLLYKEWPARRGEDPDVTNDFIDFKAFSSEFAKSAMKKLSHGGVSATEGRRKADTVDDDLDAYANHIHSCMQCQQADARMVGGGPELYDRANFCPKGLELRKKVDAYHQSVRGGMRRQAELQVGDRVVFHGGGEVLDKMRSGGRKRIRTTARMQKAAAITKVAADWEALAQHLKEQGDEICKMNGCTEDQHNCESYAYIDANGRLLDICGSDYFQGSGQPYAAIPMPWSGNPEELKSEVEEQTWDETEEEQGMDALGVSKYLRKAKKDPLPADALEKIGSIKKKAGIKIDDLKPGDQLKDPNEPGVIYTYQGTFADEISTGAPTFIDSRGRTSVMYDDEGGFLPSPLSRMELAMKKAAMKKESTCPPGLSKDVKDKVKKEYGPDDPRTYKTLWTIKDKQEGKKGSVKTADDDALMAHANDCPICQQGVLQMNPDLLCPIGQKMFKEEIEGMGGEVTDPTYGVPATASKNETIKIGHEVFVRDLGIVASVKMIEGDIMTIAHPVFGEHYYVVGDDNIVRRRRRYATDEQEINDLERMKLKIEQQKKETEDETQMQALEERLHELDMEIGRANAKQAMENPHFWDKVGEDIDGGNEKKLRSPATEEISERGHEEQEAHPSKGEPGEGTEYRHELARRRTAGDPEYDKWMANGGELWNKDSTGKCPYCGVAIGPDEPECQACFERLVTQMQGQAGRRKAEEATSPTLGGMPENVEKKMDSGEAKLADKEPELDKDIFKSEDQIKMESNDDAVVDPKKGTDFDEGGFQSNPPFVAPSAMPGQEM